MTILSVKSIKQAPENCIEPVGWSKVRLRMSVCHCPLTHTPDKGPDVGTPVRKGPQRPQISPLYQEAFKSPLETPKIPPAPPPAPPSAPPSGTTGGVYNALDDNQDVPGMAQMPALPDDVDASGKKGKNVAWGGGGGGGAGGCTA